MQLILNVDITSQPSRLLVLQVEGNRIKVVDQQAVSLPGLARINSFNGRHEAALEHAPAELAAFKEALSKIKHEWTTSVLLVAPAAYLSLNLDLPFAQPKHINKIIDMEVQDIVPFDTAEFLLYPAIVGRGSEDTKNNDVHVSAAPRAYLSQVLDFFKRCDFDPFILTTPAAAIGALFHLAPEYLARHSLIIYPLGRFVHLTFAFDGAVREDRLLGPVGPDKNRAGFSRAEILSELKLSIHSAEKRHGRKIERAYVIGGEFQQQELQSALGRETERIRFADFAELNEEASGLAAISAVFARDDAPPAILTNFRTQELAYRPRLSELYNGLRTLAPYIAAAGLLLLITLTLLHALRDQRIAAIRAAMEAKLMEVIPGIKITEGSELTAIGEAIGTITAQLNSLGSQSSTSPVDALAVFSEDLPTGNGIEIQNIDIRGPKATISGTAGDHGAVDIVKSALAKSKRKRRDVYCEIRKKGMTSQGGQVRFTYQVTLCE